MSSQKKKIGYVSMVGDLFHYGHVNQLKHVYDLGYIVITGIHNDETVASYKRKPILNMDERAKIIESCKYVSKVIKNAPLIENKEFLDKHEIDMVFHGHIIEDDYKYKKMYEVPEKLGKFTRTEYTNEISTSQIINRIVERYKSNDLENLNS